jgi:hypothetical protein
VLISNNIFQTERINNPNIEGVDLGTNVITQGNIGYVTESAGTLTAITDSNGLLFITHGLYTTPTFVGIAVIGDNPYEARIQSSGGSTTSCGIRNTTDNSDVVGVSVTIQWYAVIK